MWTVLVTFTLVADGDERTRLRVVETGLDRMDMADDGQRENSAVQRYEIIYP